MVSKYALVGISVGVFVAGLAVGYSVLMQSSYSHMTPHQMQLMMQGNMTDSNTIGNMKMK